jgi:YbbR domain-containing protein
MNNNSKAMYDNGTTAAEKIGLPKRWFFSRILCFVFALAIWVYVVNITTQDFEKTFNLIDIDIEGYEELEERTNMSVVDLEESKVSVTVKGLRSDIAKLTEKDFSAYIDVSKLDSSGKHSAEVFVNLPNTVSLVSRYPENVVISIDENVEREIDVEINVTEYNMDTIYEMGVPTSDISKVTVKGPSDIVDRIKTAKAYINLGTVMTSMVIRTEVVLVDKSGNAIDSAYLSIDNKSVTVTVPVTMEKTVKLVCSYLPGISPSLYESVYVTPDTVKVKGDPKILNAIDSFTLYALDGKSVDTSIEFSSILVPAGVELINPPEYVKIIAEIVEVSQEDTADNTTDSEVTGN